jgi:hypothetical protein
MEGDEFSEPIPESSIYNNIKADLLLLDQGHTFRVSGSSILQLINFMQLVFSLSAAASGSASAIFNVLCYLYGLFVLRASQYLADKLNAGTLSVYRCAQALVTDKVYMFPTNTDYPV